MVGRRPKSTIPEEQHRKELLDKMLTDIDRLWKRHDTTSQHYIGIPPGSFTTTAGA